MSPGMDPQSFTLIQQHTVTPPQLRQHTLLSLLPDLHENTQQR